MFLFGFIYPECPVLLERPQPASVLIRIMFFFYIQIVSKQFFSVIELHKWDVLQHVWKSAQKISCFSNFLGFNQT